MGSNRALPFGYKMEFGRIVIFPEEAGWVTYLFDQYLLGASYKGLSDEMNGYGVHYDGEKPWNKNMIARILQDCRYIGDSGFPSSHLSTSIPKKNAEKKLRHQKNQRYRKSCGANAAVESQRTLSMRFCTC